MAHEFELRKEITLEATPEEVWEAIATGAGIDGWFMGRNQVEPREGGRTAMTIGGHTEEATVTAWEPPRRFAYRTGSPDGPGFMAFEWLVEGRGDGTCVLRLVQSGVLGDDWETEYDGLDPVEGVVDYASPDILGVRGDDGLYRFVCGFDGSVGVGHHLYADDVDDKEAEAAWQAWLDRLFQQPEDEKEGTSP